MTKEIKNSNLKGSEVIETDKSPAQIRQIIARNTDEKPSSFSVFNYKPNNPYFSKFGDNYISLSTTNILLNWPLVELQMRNHTEPRLKVVFQGLYFFIGLYGIWLVSYLIALFETTYDIENIIALTIYGGMLIFIPYYAYRLRLKFKIWLTDLLK